MFLDGPCADRQTLANLSDIASVKNGPHDLPFPSGQGILFQRCSDSIERVFLQKQDRLIVFQGTESNSQLEPRPT